MKECVKDSSGSQNSIGDNDNICDALYLRYLTIVNITFIV